MLCPRPGSARTLAALPRKNPDDLFLDPRGRGGERFGTAARLSPQQMQIFVLLAARGGWHAREACEEALWGARADGSPLDARNQVSAIISGLNKILKPFGLRIMGRAGLGFSLTEATLEPAIARPVFAYGRAYGPFAHGSTAILAASPLL